MKPMIIVQPGEGGGNCFPPKSNWMQAASNSPLWQALTARTPVTETKTSATTAEVSKPTHAAVTVDLTPSSSAAVTTTSTATRTAVAVARVRALQTHVRQRWPDRHIRPAARDIAAYRISQTPLIRFVVDLLYNKLYNKSTTNPQQIEAMEFSYITS